MSTLIPLVMGAMGAYLVLWGVRTALAVGRHAPPTAAATNPGEWALAHGPVLAPAQPATSPLQGVACAWWHVRAVRIRDRAPNNRVGGLEVLVDVEVSSAAPFVVRTDHGDVTVDAAFGRLGSGLTTVHRDQASTARTLHIAGRSHDLPPVAHGTRQVKEGVLVPGQAVWVEGRVATSPAGPVLTADPDRPVQVETASLASRRRGVAGVAAVCGLIGLGLIVAAIALLG